MSSNNEIEKYTNTICEQVRWKKAKPSIILEIQNHIHDQADSYINEGENEENAVKRAISDMGDPVHIGQQFDKVFRPKPQWNILFLTGLLILTGMFINYFTYSTTNSDVSFSFVSYIIAFFILVGCYFIDFTVLGKYPLWIYTITIILSFLLMLTGVEINGRLYWIDIGSFSYSFLSLIFPLVFSLFVYAMRGKGLKGIILSELALLPMILILRNVPSLMGIVLLALVSAIVLCYSIVKGWFGVSKKQGLAILLIPAIIIAFLFFINLPDYVFHRFEGLFSDTRGSGYVYNVIKNLLSESAVFGKSGVHSNTQILRMLPNISGDYNIIYAIHEMGFIVLIIIAAIISAFLSIVFYKMRKQKNILGSLTAVSIICTFVFQTLFSGIGAFGLGIGVLSIPFITPGNSALFIDCALIGILLSVFRTGYIYKDNILDYTKKEKNIFSYKNGKLTIDIGSK